MRDLHRTAAAIAAASILVASAAMAAPPETHPGKGKMKSSFVRGDAASRVEPKPPPRNEQEAVAAQRLVAAGVIEMELPEDRMVNLRLVERDGRAVIGHHDLDAAHDHAHAPRKEAARE